MRRGNLLAHRAAILLLYGDRQEVSLHSTARKEKRLYLFLSTQDSREFTSSSRWFWKPCDINAQVSDLFPI